MLREAETGEGGSLPLAAVSCHCEPEWLFSASNLSSSLLKVCQSIVRPCRLAVSWERTL